MIWRNISTLVCWWYHKWGHPNALKEIYSLIPCIFNVFETSSLPFSSLLKSNPFEHIPKKSFPDFLKGFELLCKLCENRWQKNILLCTTWKNNKKGAILPYKYFKIFWCLFRLMNCPKKVQYLSQKHQR